MASSMTGPPGSVPSPVSMPSLPRLPRTTRAQAALRCEEAFLFPPNISSKGGSSAMTVLSGCINSAAETEMLQKGIFPTCRSWGDCVIPDLILSQTTQHGNSLSLPIPHFSLILAGRLQTLFYDWEQPRHLGLTASQGLSGPHNQTPLLLWQT